MDARIDVITLGVADLAAARRFYVEGLGWDPVLDVAGEVVFIQAGHGLVLALFGAADMEADIGAGSAEPAGGPIPLTLGHNVGSEDEVAQVIEDARKAGATVLKHPQPAFWGGYHAFFADPLGFRWEIAYNSGWRIAEDGTVTIGPVDS